MSIPRRSLPLGSSLLLGACFSPGPQLTGSTGGPGTDAPATATETTPATETATTAPTSSTTSKVSTTGETDPTGGACGTCESPTPYCTATDGCIGCERLPTVDMSCSDIDAETPLCDAGDQGGSGSCVECLSYSDCDQDSQECAPQTHRCVERPSCERHADCESGACEIDVGTCFPGDSRRWYVDDVGNCDAVECTEKTPCCEVGQAFERLAKTGGRYHIVQVAPGKYVEQVVLAKAATNVAVLGEPGAKLDVSSGAEPIVLLGNVVDMPIHIDSKLFLARLEITGMGTVGISCASAIFLGLDEVAVTQMTGSAMFAGDCRLSARRSKFLNNTGGLWLIGGEARLENSILAGTGDNPALRVESMSKLELVYSTIAKQTELAGGLLSCQVKDNVMPGIVTIRNSAVLAGFANSPLDCVATISTTTSAITSPELDVGPGNKLLTLDQVSPNFVDWAQSDLRVIGNEALLAGVALWTTGDPPTDIDGEFRPNDDQVPDFAGADVPVP